MRTDWQKQNWTWQQKRSLFIFILCNSLLLLAYFLLPIRSDTRLELDTPEIRQIKAALEIQYKEDSLRRIPIKHPFNPNYITDYQAYIFSIDSTSLAALRAYRKSDKWIHSVADFQKVTQWEEAEMKAIEAYLKFPEWTNSNSSTRNTTKQEKTQQNLVKKDLNTASKEDLLIVPGIGEVLSSRILDWRDRLDGFVDTVQFHHVYGLNAVSRANLNRYFYITASEVSPKFNVNEASASDLATIPGLNFEMARRIWEYQRLREGIDDLEELINIEGMSRGKLEVIALYLYVK